MSETEIENIAVSYMIMGSQEEKMCDLETNKPKYRKSN